MRTWKWSCVRILIVSGMVAAALVWLTMSGVVEAAAGETPGLMVQALLKPDGTLDTTTGASGTLDVRGWNVALDAKRGPLLSRVSSSPLGAGQSTSPAVADNWAPLADEGLNGTVYALAVLDDALYVGGEFTQTVDGSVSSLNGIAKYSGGAWSALAHNGLNGTVLAMAVLGSDLYVGGWFKATSDGSVTNLNGIAKYSGGVWSPLSGNGLNGYAYALTVLGSDLYVGGEFTQTADGSVTNLNRIAKFSGGGWSALAHNGLNDNVYSLAVLGSDLYVGGWFTATSDGSVTNLNHIAKYSGGGWSALAHNGLNGYVYALAVLGSDLYVGAFFTATSDGSVTNLNNIARFDPYANGGVGEWYPLSRNGLNDIVYALAVLGGDLYVGGFFTETADGNVTDLNAIAKYSGGAWSPLPNKGMNDGVRAIVAMGRETSSDSEPALYAGGFFSMTHDGSVTNLNRIAKLNPGCTSKPDEPELVTPEHNSVVNRPRVKLNWTDATCATDYQVIVKYLNGGPGFKQVVTISKAKTGVLPAGHYKWFVKARNEAGVTKSLKFKFSK